ncbi:unnamed protein product [Caenorhabditis nigoni]
MARRRRAGIGEGWHMNVNENALLGAKERRMGDSICVTYLHNFLPVDLEIVSWSPTLIIYRNLLTPRQTSEFLKFIEKRDLTIQKTTDYGTSKETTHRRANGSFIDHGENEITSEVHKKVTKRIPALNFQSAELFSALSYIPGGHYAVHYDYLSYRSDKEHDWWMNMMRNRIGTLIFVIKTAEKGGGTVFPSIGTTIKIDEGDAFFWFNAQADESQEMLSDHGGCPIYSGRKVIATLWIRAKDQPVIPMAASGSPIDASWMIPSFSTAFRRDQKSQTPIEH